MALEGHRHKISRMSVTHVPCVHTGRAEQVHTDMLACTRAAGKGYKCLMLHAGDHACMLFDYLRGGPSMLELHDLVGTAEPGRKNLKRFAPGIARLRLDPWAAEFFQLMKPHHPHACPAFRPARQNFHLKNILIAPIRLEWNQVRKFSSSANAFG